MQNAVGDPTFFAAHVEARPHLFSSTPVFITEADLDAMLAIISAIETVAASPAYRSAALAFAPEASRRDYGPAGAFMGYDFHLMGGSPRLIEINTNAGGAFLNAFSARAQLACCDLVEALKKFPPPVSFEAAVVDMFVSEWRFQRGGGRPRRIAIVDDAPQEQYLYPEFLLARGLLRAHGFEAIVCDPADLAFDGTALRFGGEVVDLVYNRLVDFTLEETRHAALRAAWLEGAVVVTPGPFNHALLANKRNLVLLSDQEALRRWGVAEEAITSLSALPRTEPVTAESADRLWAARNRLFFKPWSGHGGKAVYRGDKLTRTVWAEILGGAYVAQDLAPPGKRQILIDGKQETWKWDVRLYTYRGALLLPAARIYQGQTTNFRTPGGGFAPVYMI
jgi:hypothetical protein